MIHSHNITDQENHLWKISTFYLLLLEGLRRNSKKKLYGPFFIDKASRASRLESHHEDKLFF